jgi:hypothetical protein
MRIRRSCLAFGLWAAAAAWAFPAEAKTTFVINNLDGPGAGLNEATPVSPVGGNAGTTVGAQRLNALRAATDIWGALIDSAVPVVIDARFGPLSCTAASIVLGQARSTGLEANVPGLPANMFFPEPLADRIAGVDLTPGMADIEATFNGDLAGCSGGVMDWYYGLDAKPTPDTIDLIEVLLHELGHGLGFESGVDNHTGELAGGILDSFSAHILDDKTGKLWSQMTNAERAASVQNVRQLVWNGTNVTQTAAMVLAKGAPRITVTPNLAGRDGALAEANFGPLLSAGPVTGPVVLGTPIDGCAQPPNYNGHIVIFQGGYCPSVQKSALAELGGALAVLISDPEGISPPSSVDVPPDQNAMFAVHVPVIGTTVNDANLLAGASGISVRLDADSGRLVGADAQGRVYLYASNPILDGSTVSHWDPLTRPNLIQEPNDTYDTSHDLRMEAALMRDIGWTPFCGNGHLDPGEQCDQGASNSDTAPGACRTSCKNAACGDGVTDPGEQCDQGTSNSDTAPGACRTGCKNASCGDGITDPGEECDDGASNSDSAPGACRTSCKGAACGDGVVDPGEQCDNGTANGPNAPCGTTCVPPPAKSGCSCALGGSPRGDGAASVLGLAFALSLAIKRRARRR